MKSLFFLCLISLCLGNTLAQDLEGVAYYKTHRNVKSEIDSSSTVSADTQKQLAVMLAKQFQKEFSLQFNNKESLYKEVPSLDKPAPAMSGGFNIVVSGLTDVLYKNTETQSFVRESEIMDKPFLIKDKLEKRDWVFEKETKNIGEYTCFKATFTEEVTEKMFESGAKEPVEKKVTRTTTAWYTLQIPLGHGPADYWGLPGLVLEVNDGNQSILCTKIILNPKDGIEIEIPSRGKVVTQREYEEIQEKKQAEMMERFHDSNRKKGDGEMIIKIRG